jgi:hypothetical protein
MDWGFLKQGNKHFEVYILNSDISKLKSTAVHFGCGERTQHYAARSGGVAEGEGKEG